MVSSKLASEWAVQNPAIARGRLLASAMRLATATALINRLMGYIDALVVRRIDALDRSADSPQAVELREAQLAATEYLQLGMEDTHRELLHAVHALDIAEPEQLPNPYAQSSHPERAAPQTGESRGPLRPIHPATQMSRTATELAREVLGAEVERLRAGGGGWGGGSPEAMRICAAIEVLMDSTIAGKRR